MGRNLYEKIIRENRWTHEEEMSDNGITDQIGVVFIQLVGGRVPLQIFN